VIHLLNRNGRHVRTADSRTGRSLVSFGYDADSLLASVTDRDGNSMTIARAGDAIELTSPFGAMVTELGLDASGHLESVTDPAGQTTLLDHDADGLLVGLTDARLHAWTFEYDAAGRFTREEDLAGGSQTLARLSRDDTTRVVEHETALGVTTRYTVTDRRDGATVRIVRDPSEHESRSLSMVNETDSTYSADGVAGESTTGGDHRFGMAVPRTSESESQYPSSGPLVRTTESQTDLRFDAGDPSVVEFEERETSIRDELDLTRITRTQWEIEGGDTTLLVTSPAGRMQETYLDDHGRVRRLEVTGLAAVEHTYDAAGRLSTTQQGGRLWQYAYDDSGRIEEVEDPVGRVTRFQYDAADRLIRQTLPGDRVVGFAYNATGDLTGLTTPRGHQHEYRHTAVHRVSGYSPPDVNPGIDTTGHEYDLDHRLRFIRRPDEQD